MRFLGDSLPERLRSTTLALIGVVAAACLGMVGLTLQHGLPLASSGPIHEPVESEVGPARALTEPPPERRGASSRGSATFGSEEPVRVSPSTAGDDPTPNATPPASEPIVRAPVDSRQGDGNSRSEPPPSPAPVKASPAPAAAPTPAPSEEPVATPSREAPEPALEEPAEEPDAVPGNGHAYGKGSGGGPEGTGPPGLAKK